MYARLIYGRAARTKRHNNMAKKWTEEEVRLLKEEVGTRPLSAFAKQLNRSETAISLKLKKLGIGSTKKAAGLLTAGELAAALHIDRKIVHHWIRLHSLPATSRITCHKRKFCFIDPCDFWKWAGQHKGKVDFSAIEKNSLPPEPAWVQELRSAGVKQTKQYKRWTTKEIHLLFEWKQRGDRFCQIAEKLKRSKTSVERCYERYKAVK